MATAINQEKLRFFIEAYKADFKTYIDTELYKWRAIAHFQKYWDINAADFTAMLKMALDFKDDNLLTGRQFLPKRMLFRFCEYEADNVKQMFVNLFDERKELAERINSFSNSANGILQRHWKQGLSSYQGLRAISTYLWLMFPDKYYIYKSSCVNALTSYLGIDFKKSTKLKGQNVVNVYAIYDQVAETLMQDKELRSMLDASLDKECYSDPMARTLVVDFAYYLDKRYNQNSTLEDDNTMTNKDSKPQDNSTEGIGAYTKKDFLNDVYISESDYEDLCGILKHKKNIILQGAPGVGKTFSAKRLAYSLMGECDDERIGFVQFHQSYSYEDFVMGYKPNAEGGFYLQRGIFHKFCMKAANDPNRPYFFIIDEINRGNLSKIFGELLMLIEKDYRANKITLAYSEEDFAVPENLYIIGMMNTADRSLAMIDYALRRRFSFYPMKPGFDSEGFKRYQFMLKNEKFDTLITKVKELNDTIVKDPSLGFGFEIGHSYFCNRTEATNEWLRAIVNHEIIPMLEEYWFDNKDKIEEWSEKLRTAIK